MILFQIIECNENNNKIDNNKIEDKKESENDINQKDNIKINNNKSEQNENEDKICENQSNKEKNKDIVNKNNLNIKEIKASLKKFIYFKGEKVIGFIKFEENVTPPVNGYYFKCNYNIKVEIHMSGMIFNQDKSIKNKIDFYDGNDYIAKMKKIFSVD